MLGLHNADTVLVTGCAGFIGAALCRSLVGGSSARIVGLDNLNSYYSVDLKRSRLDLIAAAERASEPGFTFIEGDIVDEGFLGEVFDEFHPDIVVNLAAQAGVRYSFENPKAYIASNIVGFANVLEQCRRTDVSHLVYASSSSVYGNSDAVPFDEAAACNKPVSLYAATKKSDEALAYSYAALFGLKCTGLRFFTVYGPYGRPDMAYFSFAERMTEGLPIRLFNNGDMLRDFTYIDDIVHGLVRVMASVPTPDENGAAHALYNIGHGHPVYLKEFVDTLETSLRAAGVLDRPVTYEFVEMQPGDVHQTYASTSALADAFGFSAKTPLDVGLGSFARWFAQYRQLGK